MFIIYDLIFLVFAFIYLPVYLCKRKFHPGFRMRLGILPNGLNLDRPIWIHAVSVGEVTAVKNLVRELRITYPEKRFFISTVTPTGNKIAKGIAEENDFVSYFPLDLSFIVRSVADKVNPSLFIIMETEIWPNLISCLYRKKIPIVVVNGRLSDRSFKGYLCIKFLLKSILNKINLFCVQTKSDAERLLRLGVSRDRVEITGNMKFDTTDYPDSIISTYRNRDPDSDKFRGLSRDTDHKLKLGLGSNEKLLIAASTHPGEEKIILGVYKNLLEEFPDLRLLIAPRHPERAKEIEKIALKNGFSPIFISTLDLKPNTYNLKPIFILDTIGELVSFYAIADIIFVGGSLIKKGGHNILEPAGLGKPVIFGPHMFNFRDIARLFLENKACVLAHNREELLLNIKDLLRNPAKSAELSQRAKAIILQNQGATARNLGYIRNYLSYTRRPGMKVNSFRRVGLSLIIITAFALSFFLSGLNAETENKAEEKSSHEIDSYVRYMPARHEDGSSGKIAIIESGAEYSYKFKVFDKLPVKFSIDNSYIGIEKTEDTLELPAHLVGLTTDMEATLPFFHFNKTYLRIGISPAFYGDDWDFKASAFRIPSRYFLIYQSDSKWTFLSGVAVYPEFERNILPILGFIYKPNDKLVFNIIPKRPNITYSFNDRVSLFGEGGYALNSEFEVKRDNFKNIVLQYRETRLGGGIKCKLNRYIQTSVSAGGIFNRFMKYRDSLGKVDIKDGIYTEFRIEIKS